MTGDVIKDLYIVLPVHNRLESTKLLMESLAAQSLQDFKLVICDDGSTDGTSEYLARQYPNAVVLHGNGQLWWTAGINKCIEYVLSRCDETDYILTLNNDAILPRDYLGKKLLRASQYPDAIIGSLCVDSSDHSLIETSGYIMDFDRCESVRLTRPGERLSDVHKGVTEVTHLPGKGVMIPVKVFREIGLYDERNLPQYHADTDLTLRAHQAGFRVLVDFEALVYSEVNTSNMVLPTDDLTLKKIISTFSGPYAINNFWVYNNFAEKHFPDRKTRYLCKKYFRIIGGLAKRYIKSKLTKVSASIGRLCC